MKSDFYQGYCHVLSNSFLQEILQSHGLKIVLCLHVEFRHFLHAFRSLENPVVEVVEINEDETSVSDRLKECKMLVTDYSSISFDVAYLGKPVIYFQFDRDIYDKKRGSYVDMDRDLPGVVVQTEEELTQELQKSIEKGFVMEEEYKERRKKYFDFEDGHNSERIYHAILECREDLYGEG